MRRGGGRRAALLLAAGLSERMGEPKALLRWGYVTLLEFQLEQLRSAQVDDAVVVLGFGVESLQPLVPEAGWVRATYNAQYRLGRSSSIRSGASALKADARAILILAVDQPCPASVLVSLFEAAESSQGEVSLPTYQGRRGHPVVLDGGLITELRDVTEADLGLRAVVRRHSSRLVEVPVDSEMVLWNLNRPDDYQRCHEAVFGFRPRAQAWPRP